MTRQAHSRLAIAVLTAALSFTACSDDEAPPQPSAVTPFGQAAFTGVVGENVSDPLVVKVTDASGSPVGGTQVTFAVAEGGGSVTPSVDTTDGSGMASTKWRLGTSATGAQRVTASVAGVSGQATFTATASAGVPSVMAVQTGDNQSAAVGAAVPVAPSVIVKDKYNNPVPGVSVVYTVAAGGGSVTGAGSTSNANGIAAVTEWRLGALGANRLTALAFFNGVSGNPITFTANAVAGPAAAATPVGSTSLVGTAGALVTPVPGVRVVDAQGNPVSGAAVTFTPSTGSTVVAGTKNTDANGVAAPDGWQLGTVTRDYTLTASATGVAPVVFTASARAAAPRTVAISAGNNQSIVSGRTVPIDPAVRVTDGFNNPVAGVEVVFEVASGGGTALVRRPVTNADGIATVGAWTLGDEVGINTLRATVSASNVTGNPVLFTATALPGAPTSMTAVAGNNQTVTAGLPVPIPPSVVLRDNRGNPVQGTTVTFSVATGNGSVTGAVATTNAAGVATVGSWTLGPTSGVQTLVARAANLPDVTFSAIAGAGTPSNMTAQGPTNLGTFLVSPGLQATTLPSVRVTDQAGNPVSGVAVTFEVTGGFVTGESQTTNAQGIATVGSWQLPTTLGVARVIAHSQGLPDVTFSALMLPGPAAQLVYDVTFPATAPVGSPLSVSVRLTDQFGNQVQTAGISVSFAAGGTGGSVSPQTAVTNASGVAQAVWTIGTTGTQTLDVSSAGLLGPGTVSVTVVP